MPGVESTVVRRKYFDKKSKFPYFTTNLEINKKLFFRKNSEKNLSRNSKTYN